jgi:hypothetical protein
MYVPKHLAEAMAEIFDGPKGEGDMDATTIAVCDLDDRSASETGFSEQALRQLMKEAFLLELERKRQMGELMLSGKVVPLAIHRRD